MCKELKENTTIRIIKAKFRKVTKNRNLEREHNVGM